MEIKLRHLLSFDIFKDVRVLTGEHGLDNKISNISVLEMPILDFISEGVVPENEFYLTGLYAYKDNPELIEELFDRLINENCSGVCVFDTYYKDFDEAIIRKCEASDLAIMIIPERIPYAAVLNVVFQELLRVKDERYINTLLENMITSDQTPKEVRKNAMFLNGSFYEGHFAFFINNYDSDTKGLIYSIKGEKWVEKTDLVTHFRDGILVIITIHVPSVEKFVDYQKQVINYFRKKVTKYHIGVSNFNRNLSQLHDTIKEAIVANSACLTLDQSVVLYEKLGVYKLLYQLKSDIRLSRYRDEILNPIIEYEKNNNISLLETAKVLIENDGDMKKTAEVLFLHINTVRYRIDKIKSILGQESSQLKFFEQLSLAIKADQILKTFS